MLLVYIASLVLLLVTAFWTIDTFTTQIVQSWNLDNFRIIVTDPTYLRIIGRTIGIAAAVTVTDIVLAFPLAYYMARVASRRVQTLLFAAVLLPLWASYLARLYAWILILGHSGLLNWSVQLVGLPPPNIGYTVVAMWIVFSYIWLPFMVIPTYAALERVPDSLLEAAADLGARRWRAVRDIVLPLVLPGIVAGSLLVFTISIDDYVITSFVAGVGATTLPLQIYSMLKVGVTPDVNAVATLLVFTTVVLIVLAQRLQQTSR